MYKSHRKYKSQAALEFLTTYAWAFIVIAIVIAAIAYFGILSPSKLLPDRCNFGSEFSCLSYQTSAADNKFKIRLRNNLGVPITVQSITLGSESATQFTCTTTPMDYTSQLWGSSFWSSFDINSFNGALVNNGVMDSSHHTDTADPGAWIKLDTGSGNERAFTKVRYWASASGYSGIWDIQYSDDGNNWNTAYSGWNSGASSDSSLEFGNFGQHQYWRLYKTNPAFGGPWQNEIQFYEGSVTSLAAWTSGQTLDLTWSNCNSAAAGIVAGEKGKILLTMRYYPIAIGAVYAKDVKGEIFSTVV